MHNLDWHDQALLAWGLVILAVIVAVAFLTYTLWEPIWADIFTEGGEYQWQEDYSEPFRPQAY